MSEIRIKGHNRDIVLVPAGRDVEERADNLEQMEEYNQQEGRYGISEALEYYLYNGWHGVWIKDVFLLTNDYEYTEDSIYTITVYNAFIYEGENPLDDILERGYAYLKRMRVNRKIDLLDD